MTRNLCVAISLVVFTLLASPADAGAIFRIVGEITSSKELSVYGYQGDGVVSADDFLLIDAELIGTVWLELPEFIAPPDEYSTSSQPEFNLDPAGSPAGFPVTVDFDITEFLESLPSGTNWVGFSLRESESDGSVVTLEYLVLGTFLGQALNVGVTGVATVNFEGTSPVVGPITTGLPHDINNPPGPTENRGVVEFKVGSVPEPTTAVLLLLGGAFTVVARRRRRTT